MDTDLLLCAGREGGVQESMVQFVKMMYYCPLLHSEVEYVGVAAAADQLQSSGSKSSVVTVE